MNPMPAVMVADPVDAGVSALGGKYLAFALADEEYCLPVLKVREIIKAMDITQVPQVPAHVRGVINLRGKVIPVVDLRLKFGFEERAYTARTCIIVVEVARKGATTLMGVVVDTVSEVLNIAGTDIDRTPDFGGDMAPEMILGLAKIRGSVKILLDLDRVLGADGVPGNAGSGLNSPSPGSSDELVQP